MSKNNDILSFIMCKELKTKFKRMSTKNRNEIIIMKNGNLQNILN